MTTTAAPKGDGDRRLSAKTQSLLRLLLSFAIAVLTLLALRWGAGFLRDTEASRIALLIVGLLTGVVGVWAIYWVLNDLMMRLPTGRVRNLSLAYVFVGPALVLLVVFLLYPAINTIRLSFFDAKGQTFVGLQNYVAVLTSPEFLIVLRNNLLWLVFGTLFCVSLGLVIATLVDRVRRESFWKTWIFLPLAISAVGASVTWKFMYAYAPANRPQIGLFNAVITALGSDPVAWLIEEPLNNLALIAIFIWAQTGFCMVILSAALKGVPTEIVEAARIDGASEVQIFFRVLIPTIRGTIFTVTTTIVVAVLKVFDIVYTMTGGNFHTQVIANAMYQDFKNIQYGRSAALAVILLIAVVPVMIINVRNLRQQRTLS